METMSAFVVDDKTINRIATFLHDDYNNKTWTLHRLEEIGITTQEELGKAMFDLNVNAVNQRYGDGQAATFRSLDYQFTYELVLSTFQAVKSLKCWLYQCSEGDVPETPLYKIMDDYCNNVMYHIVSSNPQYERAAWG
jgi:hypothetical protein